MLEVSYGFCEIESPCSWANWRGRLERQRFVYSSCAWLVGKSSGASPVVGKGQSSNAFRVLKHVVDGAAALARSWPGAPSSAWGRQLCTDPTPLFAAEVRHCSQCRQLSPCGSLSSADPPRLCQEFTTLQLICNQAGLLQACELQKAGSVSDQMFRIFFPCGCRVVCCSIQICTYSNSDAAMAPVLTL